MSKLTTLEYFRISSTYGFLNYNTDNTVELMYPVLHNIACNLHHHIKNHTLETAIASINIGETTNLSDSMNYELYTMLSIISSGYIWEYGEGKHRTSIPTNLSTPLISTAKYLGLKPFITHAALDLNNWQYIDSTKEFSLDNITTRFTFTGTESESWFYLIMIAIEHTAAPLINRIINMYENLNTMKISDLLLDIIKTINRITEILVRMYEKCDRKHFYQTHRIFLTGSTNKNLFPNGLDYGSDKLIISGGSAAQSTLIQLFDVVLGIKHSNNFLIEMREYMPRWHRQLLIWLESKPTLFEFIDKNNSDDLKIYNTAIAALANFRQKHMTMVKFYIINNSSNDRTSAISAEGTGGTGLTNVTNLLEAYKLETINSICD